MQTFWYSSLVVVTGRSVTSLEYLTARSKGIPVYAFVEKRILAILPLYEANPKGDFSNAVDNPRVFEFVKDLRDKERVWTFEFETAEDIIQSLRLQFAHLFHESLGLTAKLRQSGLQETLAGLSGQAFSLALEQPEAWEHLLFSRVLQDEITACKELRLRYRNAYALGPGERISILGFGNWSSARIHELERVVDVLNRAMNVDLQTAFGAPGEPGSVEEIVSTAQLIGEAYRGALQWSLGVRRASGNEALRPVIDSLALFPDDLVTKVESFGDPLTRRIEAALLTACADNPVTVDANLKIELSNLDEYQRAMQQLQQDIACGRVDPSEFT